MSTPDQTPQPLPHLETEVEAMPPAEMQMAEETTANPTENWSRLHKVAAQAGVRILHALELGAGGRGAHTPRLVEQRTEERRKVGLVGPGLIDSDNYEVRQSNSKKQI
jgi:hypothetical protein